jgi:hypothetical protein
MLPSPATERRERQTWLPDTHLMSCEAELDLIFARARQPFYNQAW